MFHSLSKFVLLTMLSWSLLGVTSQLNAQSDEAKKGREILSEAISRDDGFGDSTVELEMVLRNAKGKETKRFQRSKTLEVPGDGDKLLIVFDQPRDVKGTAFLTVTHQTGPDDQWLYLPALRRVKRIASNNKSGPFMGSEFAYEDLVSEEIDKYKDYRFLKEEACDDAMCFAVERVPVDPKSGYKRQIVWVDQKHYRVMKIEYYDRKNSLLKTRTHSKYHLFLDKYWRAGVMEMQNHQTRKSTTLLFKNYKMRVGLTSRDFDKNALKRAR